MRGGDVGRGGWRGVGLVGSLRIVVLTVRSGELRARLHYSLLNPSSALHIITWVL